ncbi:hypothetical protein [Mesorhizobium huakuii]|uniref:Uncharacterized protein n=1 Tax=Mesorhizobium huakuii TaxID=28104 RepID=A0ABZ0VIX9_9HYPH|nr:hypothetical protein [Mesorhizobium huakuii]WQB97417.1 hypothetical protein U0R22_001547 [Mesorhizobium huakuii]
MAEPLGQERTGFLPFWLIFRKPFVVSGGESVQKRKIRSVFSSHFAERCSPLKVMTFFLAGPVSRPAFFWLRARCRRRADPAGFATAHSPAIDRYPRKEGEVS